MSISDEGIATVLLYHKKRFQSLILTEYLAELH